MNARAEDQRGIRQRPHPVGEPPIARWLTWAIAVIVAWGALAFGAVYRWAFIPLLTASASIAVVSLTVGMKHSKLNWRVTAALLATATAIGLQLVPLSSATIGRISPATDRLLRQYDLQYANARNDLAKHPLSIDPPSTWRGLTFLGGFGALLIGVARILTRKELERLAKYITILGATLALVGIIQRATYSGKIYGFWSPLMPNTTPFGPFVNRNHFAGWMLMGLPLAMGLLWGLIARDRDTVRNGWRARFLWFSSPVANQAVLVGFAIVAMALALVLTMSRSGMIGLVVALLLAGWLVVQKQTRRSRRAVAAGYFLSVGGLAVIMAGLDAVVARFTDSGARDLSGRLAIWTDTGRIIRAFPLFGTGLNTYGVATLFYQTTLPDVHLNEAHNDYLQIMSDGGILLGGVTLIALAVFIREVYCRFQEASDDPFAYCVRAGAVTGLIAIAVQSAADFSLQLPGNAALFVVLCAIAVHKSRSVPDRAIHPMPRLEKSIS